MFAFVWDFSSKLSFHRRGCGVSCWSKGFSSRVGRVANTDGWRWRTNAVGERGHTPDCILRVRRRRRRRASRFLWSGGSLFWPAARWRSGPTPAALSWRGYLWSVWSSRFVVDSWVATDRWETHRRASFHSHVSRHHIRMHRTPLHDIDAHGTSGRDYPQCGRTIGLNQPPQLNARRCQSFCHSERSRRISRYFWSLCSRK